MKKPITNKGASPAERLDEAFVNYFELTEILRNDVDFLLTAEENSESWRRNFLRTCASLIEGYIHCIGQMSVIGLEFDHNTLTEDEQKVLTSERGFSAADRFEFKICAAYKLFKLDSAPHFDAKAKETIKNIFNKRNDLMHPKNANGLEISEKIYKRLHDDIVWMLDVLFKFVRDLKLQQEQIIS